MPRVDLIESSIARDSGSDTPTESECFISAKSARSAYFPMEENDGKRGVCDAVLKKYGECQRYRMDW